MIFSVSPCDTLFFIIIMQSLAIIFIKEMINIKKRGNFMQIQAKKLVLAGILTAVGVILSPLNIPIGIVKAFPIQHFINVLAAVILGKYYGTGIAFATSLIRVMLGMGTLLAFPGSMIGAFLAGVLYSRFKKIPLAFLGEIIGTGLLGALAAYPFATLLMGKESAIFAFIIPFSASTLFGAALAIILLYALKKTPVWKYVTENQG